MRRKEHINYWSWIAMKKRCNQKTSKDYPFYGAAGIKIEDSRWLDFNNFTADMGLKPTKQHSIDRIDNSKGYYKENCRWATPLEQTKNRRPIRLTKECRKGHTWTTENTIITNKGTAKRCRICLDKRMAKNDRE